MPVETDGTEEGGNSAKSLSAREPRTSNTTASAPRFSNGFAPTPAAWTAHWDRVSECT